MVAVPPLQFSETEQTSSPAPLGQVDSNSHSDVQDGEEEKATTKSNEGITGLLRMFSNLFTSGTFGSQRQRSPKALRIHPLTTVSFDSQESTSVCLRSSTKAASPTQQAFVLFEREMTRLLFAPNMDEAADTLCQLIPDLPAPSSLDFDGLLQFHLRISKLVSSQAHARVFLKLTSWVAAGVAEAFPRRYSDFLRFICDEGLIYDAYLNALKYSHVMTVAECDNFLYYLAVKFLKYDSSLGGYRHVGRFNRHFLELAARYPDIESTCFVSLRAVPGEVVLDQSLEFIISSAPVVASLRGSPKNVPVMSVVQRLKAFFSASRNDAKYFAEQMEIIFSLHGLSVARFPAFKLVLLLDALMTELEKKAASQEIFPELPNHRALGIIVTGQLTLLGNLFLKHLAPTISFPPQQFVTLLRMADERVESPEFLVSLLGLIQFNVGSLLGDVEFVSGRLHVYAALLQGLSTRPRAHVDADGLFLAEGVPVMREDLTFLLPEFLLSIELGRADLLAAAALVVLRLWSLDIRKYDFYVQLQKAPEGLELKDVASIVNGSLEALARRHDAIGVKYRIQFQFI